MTALNSVTVATFDGKALSFSEFLHALKVRGDLNALLGPVIEGRLIASAAQEEGISVNDDELQRAADDFRRGAGLHKAEATQEWLEQSHLTAADLESSLENGLLRQKLAQKLTQGRVEEHFARNRAQYDQVELSHLVVAKEGVATELLSQIQEEGLDIADLAVKHSLDEGTRRASGYLGLVSRADLKPAVAKAVFGAQAGEVIGPIQTDRGYHLIKVEAIHRAELNEETAAAIRQELFSCWLQEQTWKGGLEVKLFDYIDGGNGRAKSREPITKSPSSSTSAPRSPRRPHSAPR
jgi:putative peptide maturation system protein